MGSAGNLLDLSSSVQAFNNLGKPVTGNSGVANPLNQAGMPAGAVNNNPYGTVANPLSNVGNGSNGLISGGFGSLPTTGGPGSPVMAGQATGAVNTINNTGNAGAVPLYGAPGTTTGVAAPGSTTVTNPVTGNTTSSTSGVDLTGNQQQELNKQLVDIYGKGTGNLLTSEINNLGSDNSTYMQAYEAAMAPINAENLATLNTTLGNEGVSGNSSTAAIANADFQSNVTSQEGLQEQQLQMNDLQQLLGLTESTMGASQAEVSSGGFLNDLGSVLGAISPLAAMIPGGQIAGALGSGISGISSSTDISGMAEDMG